MSFSYFSSGVHLAISAGLASAISISASIRGEVTEEEAARWHSARVGTSYTRFVLKTPDNAQRLIKTFHRFLVVVLSAYQQVRNQQDPILADVNELDFTRAFGHFRSSMCFAPCFGMPDLRSMLFSYSRSL